MTTQPTQGILTDPPPRRAENRERREDQGMRVLLADVPPSEPQTAQRPADSVAYPSGWLDPHGNRYRCVHQADEHDRIATALGPLWVPGAAGDWRRGLELAGWRALYSDGTLRPDGATPEQLVYLMSLFVDQGEELEPRYRDGLVRTIYQLLGRPLAPDAPLPARLPLPPLASAREVARELGYVAGWIAPDGHLYTCVHQGHDRLAGLLVHALGVAGPAHLDAWRRLERAGWAHLRMSGDTDVDGLLTQPQVDTLWDVLMEPRLTEEYRRRLALWIVPDADLEQREAGV